MYRLSLDSSVLYFSEAYPTTSDDRYLFGSLSIRRLVFATGEVDSYAGIDHSHDNTTAYVHIGGEGGTTDGLVEEAEFVYPMSFAVVDSNGNSVSSSGRVLNEADVPFDTLIVADHSSHSVRRVFAFMDTSEPTAVPTEYVPPTHAPTPSPTSLHNSILSDTSTTAKVTVILAVTFSILFCVVFCFTFCSWRRKRKDISAGGVELTPSRSSASVLTLASYKTLNLFAATGGAPQYEEMDTSHTSSMEEVDLESDGAEGRKWSDLTPPTPVSATTTGLPLGTGGYYLGSLWTGLKGAMGVGVGVDVGASGKEREIAVHNLLDVSDSTWDDQ
jgi:hypothetical protein